MIFRDCYYGAWKYEKDGIQTHLSRTLDGLREVRSAGIGFDAVAVHGTSGTWLGALLVMNGYDVVMVRKDGENAHGEAIEGTHTEKHKFEKLVFVDDLICGGDTVNRVLRKVENKSRESEMESRVVAIVLHNQTYKMEDYFGGIPIFGYKENLL